MSTARRPSTLRALAVSLLALAVVPAAAFVAFEWRLARESEAALAAIRDEQLDALLFSVNQHAWDVTNAWAGRLQAVPGISRPGDGYAITYETWVGIRALFRAVPAVETVLPRRSPRGASRPRRGGRRTSRRSCRRASA